MDTRNNNTMDSTEVFNNKATPEESPVKVSVGSKVNTWDNKDSNRLLDQQKTRQNNYIADKVDTTPHIPSRSLKPTDILASLATKTVDMDEEQSLLEESMRVEEVW